MDSAERARLLVEANIHLPRRISGLIFPRVKGYVEFDELVALGNVGLTEAAQRFDPDAGVTFTTFAWYRIHGSIIDGLRRASSLPRRTWARLIALRAANDSLEVDGERRAVVVRRGGPQLTGAAALAAVREALANIKVMYMMSLEGVYEGGSFEAADPGPVAPDRIDTQRFTHKLREALKQLPPKERKLVHKHYFEGKNLLEAGAELGISKSWACRLHAQAVGRLRAIIDG